MAKGAEAGASEKPRKVKPKAVAPAQEDGGGDLGREVAAFAAQVRGPSREGCGTPVSSHERGR